MKKNTIAGKIVYLVHIEGDNWNEANLVYTSKESAYKRAAEAVIELVSSTGRLSADLEVVRILQAKKNWEQIVEIYGESFYDSDQFLTTVTKERVRA